MKIVLNIATVLMMGIAIAACSNEDNSVFRYVHVLDSSHIAVRARSAADAIVTANGELSIAGSKIEITLSERDLLKRYFASVIALRSDAVATGKAGVRTATHALAGLASGNVDKLDNDVDAQAAEVDVAAAQVCKDLSAIQSAQSAIVEQLVAFKPYALIDAKQVRDCEHN